MSLGFVARQAARPDMEALNAWLKEEQAVRHLALHPFAVRTSPHRLPVRLKCSRRLSGSHPAAWNTPSPALRPPGSVQTSPSK